MLFIQCILHIWSSKRKRKRSDSILWQTPLHPQKTLKSKATTQKRHLNIDYTTIAKRLRAVSWGDDSNPIGVVKPVCGIPSFPLTTKAVKSKWHTFNTQNTNTQILNNTLIPFSETCLDGLSCTLMKSFQLPDCSRQSGVLYPSKLRSNWVTNLNDTLTKVARNSLAYQTILEICPSSSMVWSPKEKKEVIWRSRMTNTPTRTDNAYSGEITKALQKYVRLHSDYGPT